MRIVHDMHGDAAAMLLQHPRQILGRSDLAALACFLPRPGLT